MSPTELDADKIRERISQMSPGAVEVMREVLRSVRVHGSNMSEAQVRELAKKVASKAKGLANSESAR